MIHVLGTAQFGNIYGITNFGKALQKNEVNEILDLASRNKIVHLDTSCNYGTSEESIKDYTVNRFIVSTKVNFRKIKNDNILEVEASVRRKLGMHQVRNCFIHDWPDLNFEEKLQIYQNIRSNSSLKWGPSIYEPKEVIEIINCFPDFRCIQLPSSILDQRFSPYFHLLKSLNIEIWLRSIFLQGLVSNDAKLTKFKNHPDINRLNDFCTKNKYDPIHVGLEYIKLTEGDFCIFGVASTQQLLEIVKFIDEPLKLENYHEFASNDESLLDPRKWGNV